MYAQVYEIGFRKSWQADQAAEIIGGCEVFFDGEYWRLIYWE